MTLAILGCGLMGGGIASLASPDARMVLIDRDESRARALAEAHGGAWSADAQVASEADVVAVVLPALAVEGAFLALADIVKPGAIVLDMATKGAIPPAVREKRPDARFVEAKIVGSGVGVALGLKALLVVDTQEESALCALRAALPGFMDILSGDTALVPQVNAKGAYYGLRAAIEMEESLRQMGLSQAWIKCASGCLVPGSAVGYSQGRMGKFNQEIADQILADLRGPQSK